MNTTKISNFGIALATTFICSGSVLADNLALLIANTNYKYTTTAIASGAIANSIDEFEQAGYSVTLAKNLNLADLQNEIENFAQNADPSDKIAFVFSGHLLSTTDDTFITPIDLRNPTPETIEAGAVRLSDILGIASNHAGGAAVFLGSHKEKTSSFGRHKPGFNSASGLGKGMGGTDIPQGVLVVSGRTQNLVKAMSDQYLKPNQDIFTASQNDGSDVRAFGYISRFSTLSNTMESIETNDRVEPLKPIIDAQVVETYWQLATETNTIESYQQFLNRFPKGRYSDQANVRLRELQIEARRSPEERAEIELSLNRDDRRKIQQRLTVLGFNPRGVDGIFGPGTRGAISRWQSSVGYKPSSFMDRRQFIALEEQARVHVERLAAQAEQRALEERQADARFWQQTGALGSESDLRVYLRNYPDGIYSEVAREKLDLIEQQNANQASNAEIAVWRNAKEANTVNAYQDYLSRYPNGQFADVARDALLQYGDNEERRKIIEAARKEEKSLNINSGTWKMVENRLKGMGLKPGPVDGKVTKQTRMALRQYQKASKLNVSGFIDRRTLSTLIISGFFK